MGEKYIIYTLHEDTSTPFCFYVGRTTESRLKHRLKEHKKRRGGKTNVSMFIKQIYDAGGSVVMTKIDETNNYELSFELESYWMQQLKSWGFALLNIFKNPDSLPSVKSKQKRPQKKYYIKIKDREGYVPKVKMGKVYRYPYHKKLIKFQFTRNELKLIRSKYKPGDDRRISEQCDKGSEYIRICLKGKQKLVRIELYSLIKKYYGIK